VPAHAIVPSAVFPARWQTGDNAAGTTPGAVQNNPHHPEIIIMKTKTVFFHAGCPVCVEAERHVARALDPARFDVEIVHLGMDRTRLGEAEQAGVKSVPALVAGGAVYHINFGAPLAALRG
jgi:glutaredoxin